jgi:hypothetical protein
MATDTLRFTRERRWVRWACLLWAITLLVLCVRIYLWPWAHNTFLIFARAAQNWHAGTGLYGKVAKDLDVFRYSPLVACLLAPWNLVPSNLGSALWILLNAAVFLGGLCWWQRALAPGRVSLALVALIALPLAIASLHNGQCNALVMGLILAGVAGTARQRWNLAAACIALATFLKLYPLVIGLLLVALYPRKLAGRLAIALGIGLLLPFLLQQPGYVFRQYTNWVHYLHDDDRTLLPLERWPRDFRLLCRVWLTTPAPALYLLLQALTGLGVAGLCLLSARRGRSQNDVLILLTGLGCCWMTVFGPATETNTYVLLAPTTALALAQAWSGNSPRWRKGLLAGIFGLFLGGYAFKWFSLTEPLCNWGAHPFAGLLLFLLLGGEALARIVRRPMELPAQQLPRAA